MNDRDTPSPLSQPNQELDWLAFCYIADELDESARTRFEARLQNDTVAQLAVVDAMEQAQLIYTSLDGAPVESREPVSLGSRNTTAADRSTKRSSLKRASILFTSAAAMLMLVVGWGWYTFEPDVAAVATGDSERLASAWVETLVSMSDGDFEFALEEEIQSLEVGDEFSEDWMFVALTDLENSLEGPE